MNLAKILIIENSTAVTGALISVLRSSVYLKKRFQFIFVLPTGSTAISTVRANGFTVHELPLRELRKKFSSVVLYFPVLILNCLRLRRLVRSEKIDLMLVNDFYNLVPACYKFAGGSVPYISYVRFLPSKFPKALVRFWYFLHRKYAICLIAVSNAVKDELPLRDKVHVIWNELPVDDAPYEKSGSGVLLYPANYISGKGQEFALESFARIHAKFPQWILRFVGGDMGLAKNREFKQFLQNRSKIFGIEKQVEWLDFSEDIVQQYMKASIVLNFSESESFSNTCLEAMFYGRAVIATRCGGPSEIIDHQETGILVGLKDVESMANAIEYLIDHATEREVMASKAYQRVRIKFSYQNTVEKLGEVYHSALLK